jgi:hypothetical protein
MTVLHERHDASVDSWLSDDKQGAPEGFSSKGGAAYPYLGVVDPPCRYMLAAEAIDLEIVRRRGGEPPRSAARGEQPRPVVTSEGEMMGGESRRRALARARTRSGQGAPTSAWAAALDDRQYLREGLLDELHLALSPVLLGRGAALFEGIDWRALGYRCVERVAGEKATHVVIAR